MMPPSRCRRRPSRSLHAVFVTIAVAVAASLALAPRAGRAAAVPPRYQAVWVDAFHDGFKTPEQTRTLIDWARRHYVNALFIEVRKAGDAYYQSKVEPLASDVAPGYDPLADVLAQAHDTRGGKPRIEIHAWLIVYRVATNGTRPAGHVAVRHPEWLGQTYGASRKDEGDSFLDPGIPEVINHTDRVVADLVSRYDLDGIHFDRIRYPGEQWGYNPLAVARFKTLSHRLLRPKPNDAAWSEFRRQQVSMMLRRLFMTSKGWRPTVKVSAATIAFDECKADFRESRSFYDVFQDWRTWVRADLLDLNIPMIYKRDHVAEQARDYRGWLDFLALNRGTALPIVGQGSFINSPAGSLRQIGLAFQHSDLAGVCLFSYAQLAREGDRTEVLTEGLRGGYFRPSVPVPRVPAPADVPIGWIAGYLNAPAKDYVEVVLQATPPRPTHTDGAGFFAFTRVPVGDYQVTATAGRRQLMQSVRVSAGKVAWVKLGS